ncbi:MAG TPA: hypothetical protein VIF11_15810 [Methylomirabilota bacterium]|jgi:hypothetical protein
MDATETALLVGLAALGVGVVIGWHMRLQAKQTRARGAAPTAPAKAELGPTMNRFSRPVSASSASSAGCGCS